ncbi:aminopeptidase [Halorubellus salinus]|uniref:aminopeptidase n=1 Tax=Halorubellus salinus TaxID=755309 RepID=UPI001D08332A|nr:aminopeptidase [Halorubellus salinus]
MSDLSAPARTAIEQCMDVSSGESVVVVTDDERRPIGEALYDAALAATDDATILQYPPGENHGEEPPAAVAAAMAAGDVFLAPTSKSLSHTRARSAATEAGARGATLPGITEDVFTTGLDADYEQIAAHCEDVLAQVADADEVRVTTDLGTDITFEAGEREWLADTGMVHDSGDFSNLPAGEVFVAPETANGRFVVDGTMMPYERLDDDQTLAFDVEDGQVVNIEDDRIAEQFADLAEEAGDVVYNLAELGIGTNVAVTDLVGSVLLDEKAAGTVHIAIGDNAGIGGDTDAPIHSDGVIQDPTVYADEEVVDLPTVERP